MKKKQMLIGTLVGAIVVTGCVGLTTFKNESNASINTSNISVVNQTLDTTNNENPEEASVDSTLKYLKENGYTDDEVSFYEVCKKIENIKSNDNTIDVDTIVQKIDQLALVYIGNNNNNFVAVAAANEEIATGSSKFQTAYNSWASLTKEEKKLAAIHPAKALKVNSTSKKAFNLTKKQFGYNGLGDKSDGFRHAIWNALMTKEIGKTYAEKFATAHESGKTSKQLQKKAKDGYTEKDHRTMDLHNNKIGRSLVKYKQKISDTNLIKKVKKKLTNNKKTGIYWLHK